MAGGGLTLLAEVAPAFAAALERELLALERPALAEQVPSLRVVARCACEFPSCGSFFTIRPMKRWFRKPAQVELGGELAGKVFLDVVGGEIAYVEVIGVDEVRAALERSAVS